MPQKGSEPNRHLSEAEDLLRLHVRENGQMVSDVTLDQYITGKAAKRKVKSVVLPLTYQDQEGRRSGVALYLQIPKELADVKDFGKVGETFKQTLEHLYGDLDRHLNYFVSRVLYTPR